MDNGPLSDAAFILGLCKSSAASRRLAAHLQAFSSWLLAGPDLAALLDALPALLLLLAGLGRPRRGGGGTGKE